jgi:hypothetical protein
MYQPTRTDNRNHRGGISNLAEEAAKQWTAGFNPRPITARDFVRLCEAAFQRGETATWEGSRLTLQRHFQISPLLEVLEAAFAMGFIGAVIAFLMIANEDQHVGELVLGMGQTPLQQCPNLGQRQRRGFLGLYREFGTLCRRYPSA